MRKIIRASQDQLVDVMAKTVDGEWVLIFEQIPESQATAIWRAGFATGENRFSIHTEEGKRVMEYNKKALSRVTSSTDYDDESIDDFLEELAYETCDLEEEFNDSEFAEFKKTCKDNGYKVTKRDFEIYLDKVRDIRDNT